MLAASVIVPTYNRASALVRTLDALLGMDIPAGDVEILVVDTGSPDPRVEDLVRSRGIRYLRHADEGVASARNRGASQSSGEVLMFVDDDIIVGTRNLLEHLAIHREHECCLVSGHWEFDALVRAKLEASALGRYRLRYEDRYNTPNGVDPMNSQRRVHPLTLAAGNLSVGRSTFESLGGFDERFPVGAEDQDLSWRARGAGCTLVYDYGIRVIHNDQHADLAALCRRQERAAIGTVYFALKNPDAPGREMLHLNGPLQSGDSPHLIVRKLSRAALSMRLPLALAHHIVRAVEWLRPNGGWPLEYVYDSVGGLYVFRGVRRGLRMTSTAAWESAHDGS